MQSQFPLQEIRHHNRSNFISINAVMKSPTLPYLPRRKTGYFKQDIYWKIRFDHIESDLLRMLLDGEIHRYVFLSCTYTKCYCNLDVNKLLANGITQEQESIWYDSLSRMRLSVSYQVCFCSPLSFFPFTPFTDKRSTLALKITGSHPQSKTDISDPTKQTLVQQKKNLKRFSLHIYSFPRRMVTIFWINNRSTGYLFREADASHA